MTTAKGYLTTHVLDTAKGRPAAGMKITLYLIEGAEGQELANTQTNADGRTDKPILPAADFAPGVYELEFQAGAYLRESALQPGAFLDVIPIRFIIEEAESHYHVPLLLSPYGYSTYRGS